MAEKTRRPGPGGDPMQRNPEDNQAQAQSDATPDQVGDERARGGRSDANGVPEFDEAQGEERKKIYKESGSDIVSRID
jgi:hypothetical protein